MITIAICDDEKEQRNALSASAARQMELCGIPCRTISYSGGDKLLMELNENPYLFDIIFLDIELGGANGVDTAKQIRKKNRDCIIIFVTGYSDYVFHGYEVGALNYILKPYKEQKIGEVLKEALIRMNKWKEHYIAVQSGSDLIKVPTKDILYFMSQLRKIILITREKEWTYYGRLADMEKSTPDCFVRIHQRYLVNMAQAERLNKDSVLIAGQTLPVSRQHYADAAGVFTRLMLYN